MPGDLFTFSWENQWLGVSPNFIRKNANEPSPNEHTSSRELSPKLPRKYWKAMLVSYLFHLKTGEWGSIPHAFFCSCNHLLNFYWWIITSKEMLLVSCYYIYPYIFQPSWVSVLLFWFFQSDKSGIRLTMFFQNQETGAPSNSTWHQWSKN